MYREFTKAKRGFGARRLELIGSLRDEERLQDHLIIAHAARRAGTGKESGPDQERMNCEARMGKIRNELDEITTRKELKC
jgi:hypothetical protein